MKPTITTLVVFLSAIPLLLMSYHLGTPEQFSHTKIAIGDYLNRPPLGSVLGLPTRAQIPEPQPQPQRQAGVADLDIQARSALAWDIDYDLALFAKNMEEMRPIASLTKLVTAAVVLDQAQPEEIVEVSSAAVAQEGVSGNLYPSEELKVHDLLAASLLESSNDAAFALAEYVGQKIPYLSQNPPLSNQQVFARAMNEKFAQLGLTQSYFTDPAGLDDRNSFSSAHDLVRFIKYLRTNPRYNLIWQILQLKTYKTQSADGRIRHEFKTTNPFLEEFGNVIGGKTGYTGLALGNMILVMFTPDNTSEVIYVVLGSSDRFGDTRKLVEWVGQAWSWPTGQ
ncbi:MAG: D-alanyl-D-alanine carboxypeptidase [Parcubacteria group bacterium]|nr:D-alanyl-D-alanine carboxypeptidase [Parcubacteria group bacterium]